MGVLFTTTRKELAAALAWAAKGLPTRPAVPVLAGMLVQSSAGRVTVAGFDYGSAARAHVGADVAEAGQVLARGQDLVKAVKGLPGKPGDLVTVLAAPGTDGGAGCGVLTVETGGVSATVDLLPLADYPQLPAMPPQVAVMDGAAFAGAVGRVSVAASTDDTLPGLTGVHLGFGDGTRVVMHATDRYRLAVEDAPATHDGPAATRRGMLVHARTLAGYAKTCDQAGKVTVHQPAGPGSAEWVGFSDGTRDLITRTIDGEFPDYRNFIPETTVAAATVDAGALGDALKRAETACTKNEAVRLHFYRNRVTVTGHGEGGQVTSRQQVPATVDAGAVGDGPARVIGWHVALSAGYLRSLVAGVSGPARLGFRPGGKPVLVTPAGGGAFTGLVCPIRLDGGFRPQPAKPAKPAPAPKPAPERNTPPTPAAPERNAHPVAETPREREGRQVDDLAHGGSVPGGPGACGRPGCGHAKPYHTPTNRQRPCERCDCPRFVPQVGAGLSPAERAAATTPSATTPAAPVVPAHVPGLVDMDGRPVRLHAGTPETHTRYPTPDAITRSRAGGRMHFVATWLPTANMARFTGKRGANRFMDAHYAAWRGQPIPARPSARKPRTGRGRCVDAPCCGCCD